MNNDIDTDKTQVESQTVVTAGTIITAAINGIVGYVAVYFFQPIWLKIVKWWDSDVPQK
jgi:hypothetical protein